MSDEKKISDDELVEVAGGGVVVDLNGTGATLEQTKPEVIGIEPGKVSSSGGGSITPNPESSDPEVEGQGGGGQSGLL